MSVLAISANPYFLENSDSKVKLPENPLVAYDPRLTIKTHLFWSKLHKVVALVALVGFTAIATAAIAFTTIHWAVHLPIISILIFAVGLPSSFRFVKYFLDKSDRYNQEAKLDAKLITHLHEMNTDCIFKHLSALGIEPGIEVNKLKPLLARYSYLKERQKELINKANQMIVTNELELKIGDKIHQINPRNYNSVEKVHFSKKNEVAFFDAVLNQHQERNVLLQEAAICNLKAGYLLKLVQNPYEQRQFCDFIECVTLSYPQRLMAKDLGDKRFDVLVKTPKVTQYSTTELLKMDTYKIAKEIFDLQGRSRWF